MNGNQQTAVHENWQQLAMENILKENLREQRLGRRWKIFFKFLTLFYVLLFTWLMFGKYSDNDAIAKDHTALIDIKGLILDDKPANADNIITSLNNAFEDKSTKGVILRINSPGGSPVQVSNITEELHRLEKLHPRIKVYAVCTDVCASGGYWLAASADAIYANPASLVGSIGVVMEGFGFVDVMKKIGVERRLLTAGTHKGLLDPYSPLKREEVVFAERMLNTVHQQFINFIMKQRGKRLKLSNDTFSGLVWAGSDALQQGLIDGLASEEYVAREIIKEDNIVDYTVEPNYLERIANRFGSHFSGDMLSELQKTTLR